jgi:type IV pilus assembly protein PilN
MSTPAGPVLDLLRERRRELGIESLAATLSQRRALVLRGCLIGLAVFGTAVGILGALLLQRAITGSRLASLKEVASETEELQSRLASSRQRLVSLTATNRTLVTALTSGRSSSALLAELQLLTPQGVQLVGLDGTGQSLVLKGLAIDPYALIRINALLLQLRGSPLFEPEGVQLVRVERQPAKKAETSASSQQDTRQPPAQPGPVAFEIGAAFASPSSTEQLALLNRLGSTGMVQRFRMLQQEGLLP